MGIADLWPLVAAEKRVPFGHFLSRFVAEHGRPPRLAIDAYMFMFYSQLPDVNPEDAATQNRTIRNFMAKLWYFVQLNVLFVCVFDGKYKPGKLRNGHIPEVLGLLSYDELITYFRTLKPDQYPEGLLLVERLKSILQRNRMDYIQAPAEAEAECAWLQRLGVVDYVVSDDSDTLVFGASQMLRSFNRVKYMKDKKPVLSLTEYYVTPVHMDVITESTGLDRNRLVLIAVLRGGDYSSGTEGIGITRAKEIALCGTNLLSSLPRKDVQDFGALPDFSRMFVDTFVNQEKVGLANQWTAMKSELDRSDSLSAFNSYLERFLREQTRDVFGRKTTFKDVVVDDYYALLYFFPLVNSRLFRFTPFSVSYGELTAPQNDLNISLDCSVRRFNYVCAANVIGTLIVQGGKQRFEGQGRGAELQRARYALPFYRRYNLKAFALKLLADLKFNEYIELARTKEIDGEMFAVLKFQRVNLQEAVYLVSRETEAGETQAVDDFEETIPAAVDLVPDVSSNDVDEIREFVQFEEHQSVDDSKNLLVPRNDQEAITKENNTASEVPEDDDKTIEVTVPLNALRLVAPGFVETFEKRPPKRSPKKKPPPQRTTLDQIWPSMSPTKSPKKEANSPKHELPRESPRRRRSKHVPLPGQSQVTSFFSQSPVQPSSPSSPKSPTEQKRSSIGKDDPNPFADALFVPSDDDDVHDYVTMKNIISGAPLLNNMKMPVETRDSSPELSPSKRKRLALSPDVSPVKPKPRGSTRAYPPA